MMIFPEPLYSDQNEMGAFGVCKGDDAVSRVTSSPNLPVRILFSISEYPYSNSNDLSFSDPNSIHSIQADITIVDYQITTKVIQGRGSAGDGITICILMPGDGYKGDIWFGQWG